MEYLLAFFVGQFLAIPLCALVLALFLRSAHVLALERFTTYGRAYVVAVAIGFAQYFSGLAVGLIFLEVGARWAMAVPIAFGVGFFIGGWTAGALFKDPTGRPIGFARGLAVVGYLVLICLAVGLLAAGLAMLFVGCYVGFLGEGLRARGADLAPIGLLVAGVLAYRYRLAASGARDAAMARTP